VAVPALEIDESAWAGIRFAAWLLLMLIVLTAGLVGILGVRRRLLSRSGVDRFGRSGGEDWSGGLAPFKKLRDEGVLSEQEFRRLTTLVDPHARTGTPELRARHRPAVDPVGSDEARE
jgi:hypothetical protein